MNMLDITFGQALRSLHNKSYVWVWILVDWGLVRRVDICWVFSFF